MNLQTLMRRCPTEASARRWFPEAIQGRVYAASLVATGGDNLPGPHETHPTPRPTSPLRG